MALQCLAGEQYQRSEKWKRGIYLWQKHRIIRNNNFFSRMKVLLRLPHLKYSFFPQYLFIQFCSVLFLNVLFISLNWRCGPRLERDWVTWRIPRHAIHLWRSSSDCQFLSHSYFLLRHSRRTLFCFDNHTSRRGVAKIFFVVQLTYDEKIINLLFRFFSLLILVKEVSADIPEGDLGML